MTDEQPQVWEPIPLPLASLVPHPRNYRKHPKDQIVHLAHSLREHGQYRNIVAAQPDSESPITILGGHGVALGAEEAGMDTVLVVVLPIDPESPEALRILALDNTLPHLAEDDDRALTEMLKELHEQDPVMGLLGTGIDELMLANLVFVTRPGTEVADLDEAAQWVGLPGFEPGKPSILLMVHFDTPDDRQKLLDQIGIGTISHKIRETWSVWWPPRERQDLSSVRFVDESEDAEAVAPEDVV
jgi:hypothetical protein